MLAEVISFLSNSLTITILVGYIFALWAALVAWTWLDISGRTDSVVYRLGSILVVATGWFLGFAIYLLLRPNLTKDEMELRELEESILASQAHWQACPKCNYVVKEEFNFCTNCSYRLSTACSSCSRDVNVTWNVCPFCGTKQKEIESAAVKLPARKAFKSPGAVIFSSINSLIKKLNETNQARRAKIRNTSRPKGKKVTKKAGRKRA